MFSVRRFKSALGDFPDFLKSLTAEWELRRARGELPIIVAKRPSCFLEENWNHCHAFPEIFFQLRGTNRFQLPQTEFDVPPGTLAILPRLTPHWETRILDKQYYAHVCLSIRPDSIVCNFVALPPLSFGSSFIQTEIQCRSFHGSFLNQILDELSLLNGQAANEKLIQALETTLLFYLRESLHHETIEAHPVISACQREVLRRLQNPSLSVVQLAELVRCHPDHLSRLYRRECGVHLRDYIVEQRMLLAEQLLATTHMSIGEVARVSGYSDHAYFSQQFRLRSGRTPSLYRREHK